jgi:hypothetical protein
MNILLRENRRTSGLSDIGSAITNFQNYLEERFLGEFGAEIDLVGIWYKISDVSEVQLNFVKVKRPYQLKTMIANKTLSYNGFLEIELLVPNVVENIEDAAARLEIVFTGLKKFSTKVNAKAKGFELEKFVLKLEGFLTAWVQDGKPTVELSMQSLMDKYDLGIKSTQRNNRNNNPLEKLKKQQLLITLKTLDALKDLLKEDRRFNCQMQNEEVKSHLIESEFNEVIQTIINGIEKHPTKYWFFEQLLPFLDNVMLEDTEVRETIGVEIEKMMDILGIESSDGLLAVYL